MMTVILIISIQSCSHAPKEPGVSLMDARHSTRAIASLDTMSCSDLVTSILKGPNVPVEKFIAEAPADSPTVTIAMLKKNKLLKTKDKFLVLEQPSVGWFNKVRKSAIAHLQSWNKNRYPIFYTSDDNNFAVVGKSIDDLLERNASGSLDADDTKTLKDVYGQITMFEKYEADIAKIIDERASLQYNIEVLKKLKLDTNPIDIKITIKKSTGDESEVITFRKEDRNRKIVLDKLNKQLKELDGKLFKNGRIEERVIKQAFLKDILTIYHREVEYAFKNTEKPNAELEKLYQRLTRNLENNSFNPSTYGVFKMDHQLFKSELARFTKTDTAVRKVSATKERVKDSVQGFLGRNKSDTDTNEKREGFLKNIYVSVSNLTVADLTRYGIVAAVGFGASQYLFLDGTEITNEDSVDSVPRGDEEVQDVPEVNRDEILQGEVEDHTEQLENTDKLSRAYVASKFNQYQKQIAELFK